MLPRPLLTLCAVIAVASASCSNQGDDGSQCEGKCDGFGVPTEDRHVQLIHVDGFRPDVFKELLDRGMLPHFEFLLSRGKVSYKASTVDKTETMKVIQSYLTGRIDTHVVGWWQFNRSDFRFRNFWLDPAEVVNYAVGLEFPVYPTVVDLLANERENVTAGMSLARRGVPFNNYGRPYLEGFKAVSDHTYFNQAHATAASLTDVLKRIGNSEDEVIPKLSMLLLAPADEFAHADGIAGRTPAGENCFERGKDEIDDAIFQILNDDRNAELGGHLEDLRSRYFTRVGKSFFTREIDEICFDNFSMPLYSNSAATVDNSVGRTSVEPILPEYILGMMVVDMELGYLINAMRAVHFDGDGNHRWEPSGSLADRMQRGPDGEGDTLFDRTLFLVFGDHGMVDTKFMMAGADENPHRHPGSDDRSFIEFLNGELGLSSAAGEDTVAADAELGIEFSAMPNRLAMPHKFTDWQSSEVAAISGEANQWSGAFFEQIREALRAELHEKYWWLFFLKQAIVDPKLDGPLDGVAGLATDTMAQMYLRTENGYRAAEVGGNRDFYNQHVRLVYGGGARNNAELFVPVCDASACSWDRRPTIDEVLAHRGSRSSQKTLIEVLQSHRATGLIFIRDGNEGIAAGQPLPASLDIVVLDSFGNRGVITVSRDKVTRVLVYHYQVDPSSPHDPLGYEELGSRAGVSGTYHEWNDMSVETEAYYHNAVAGIGSYLYSNNPAIGDVLVTHSQGWNFGANSAGHGGIHSGEKLTVMIASGPNVQPGELKAIGRFESSNGQVHNGVAEHHPTILDAAPTALSYLGYDPHNALPEFARSGRFEAYLNDWVAEQRSDILDNLGGVASLKDALAEAGLEGFEIDQFRANLERLLEFAFSGIPLLPDFADAQMDGNVLKLH